MALTGKQAGEWVKPILIIGGGLIAWKYAIKPLLEATGLKESDDDKTAKKTEALTPSADYWNPLMLKLPKSQWPVKGGTHWQILTGQSASYYARIIWESKSFWGDDEERLYGVFRTLKYKSQISFVAAVFFQTYKKDLYQFLKSFLNSEELATVLAITNKKPWGIVTPSGIKGIGFVK